MKKIKTKSLAVVGVLTAIAIILARFLGFYATQEIRISFEGIPIILAGFWFGPITGALVGGISDFLGAVIGGKGFYPPLIVAPIALGLISGLFGKYLHVSSGKSWKLIVAVIISEIICSIFVGTLPLSWLYEAPYLELLLLRLPWKAAVAVCNCTFVVVINRALYGRIVRKFN